MGRHGLKFCLLCNPDGNGSKGEDGTEAIGKYFLPPSPESSTSGWIPVCKWCAEDIKIYYDVIPLKGKVNNIQKLNNQMPGDYNHKWEKMNLISQSDRIGIYDLWKCNKCKIEVKWRGFGRPDDHGCKIS